MNNVILFLLKHQKDSELKEYGLDSESIEEFKSKIKIVSEEQKQTLGKELFDLITSKNYNEETDLEKVIELIYNGADIEYKNEEKGDFSLLRCARKNYLKTFLVLVRGGANVNQKNNYFTTATMASARHGNKEILEILILFGADINAKSKDGDNALISARRHQKIECFKLLVKAGAHLPVVSQDGTSIYTFRQNAAFDVPASNKLNNKKVISEPSYDIFEEAESRLIKINQKIIKK